MVMFQIRVLFPPPWKRGFSMLCWPLAISVGFPYLLVGETRVRRAVPDGSAWTSRDLGVARTPPPTPSEGKIGVVLVGLHLAVADWPPIRLFTSSSSWCSVRSVSSAGTVMALAARVHGGRHKHGILLFGEVSLLCFVTLVTQYDMILDLT